MQHILLIVAAILVTAFDLDLLRKKHFKDMKTIVESNLVPLRIKEQLPGLDEDVSAVGVARHDGLLHHPPVPLLAHQDGHARGQEHPLPVP